MTHSQLKRIILIRYGSDPRCRIFNCPTGVYYTDTGIPVKVGVKGQADILGIRCDGIFLAIEVKAGHDRLRPEQQSYRDMVLKFGGRWVEARTPEDVEKVFDDLKKII